MLLLAGEGAREVQPNLVCGDRRHEGLELWAWWAKGTEEDESVDADSEQNGAFQTWALPDFRRA